MNQLSIKSSIRRTVRSYVVRGGRLTSSQAKAMRELWPQYGLEMSGLLNAVEVFGRDVERVFEIGFGMGESLLEMAANQPEKDFIGVDVHPPGIGTLLRGIEEKGLTNVRVFKGDAREVLKHCISAADLERILIYFPDPWHKKRHNKRRLVQDEFVELLKSKLRPGGVLHLATDWQNYAEQMMEVLSRAQGLENMVGPGLYASETGRPKTKFERRGERLGHGVRDLLFVRVLEGKPDL